MSHDREFCRNRLRGLALMIERGQVDGDFSELGVSGDDQRAVIVREIRELADKIGGDSQP